MLYVLILICEVAFWVLLMAALAARYLLRRARLSRALLLAVPAADLVLFTATTADLARGGAPGTPHALAAVYLGCSLAYGSVLTAWADRRIGPLFGGPKLPPPPRTGHEHAVRERMLWFRHLCAFVIGSAFVGLDVLVVGTGSATRPLVQLLGVWALILGIDFLWSFSYTLFPRKEKEAAS